LTLSWLIYHYYYRSQHCRRGASIWEFASTDGGKNPDVVLVGIGGEVTFEVIAATVMLRQLVPELRVRVVNVTDLMVLGAQGTHPHALSDNAFNDLFTSDKHVHFNFHGYPIELQGLLFGRRGVDRVSVEGYQVSSNT
jgi:xylulose-5-phosphate/fructose-6-phosphate phosphoketolase